MPSCLFLSSFTLFAELALGLTGRNESRYNPFVCHSSKNEQLNET